MHNDQAEIAYSHLAIGYIARIALDFRVALAHFEECLPYFRAVNDTFHAAWVLMWVGHCTKAVAGVNASIAYYQESLALHQVTGDPTGLRYTSTNLSSALMLVGQYAEAEVIYRDVKGLDLPNSPSSGFTFPNDPGLGFISFLRGDFRRVEAIGERTLQYAADSEYLVSKSFALSLLGLSACVQEQYAEGVKLGHEARSVTPFIYWVFLGDWLLSLAYCGLEDWVAARKSAHAALSYTYQIKGEGAMTWCLPSVAIILAHEGEHAQAVSVLSLASQHPRSEPGWLKKWPQLTQLRDQLKAELGAEAYNIAWERGKSLDLETVVQDLLAEFGTDEG